MYAPHAYYRGRRNKSFGPESVSFKENGVTTLALLFILDDNRCCCHKSATESTCLMAIQFSLSLYIASAASKLGCRPRCRRSVSTPMAHHACLAANPCTEGKIGAIHDWDVRIKSWKTTRVIFLAGHFIVSASLQSGCGCSRTIVAALPFCFQRTLPFHPS